jgi:hypothetical protein
MDIDVGMTGAIETWPATLLFDVPSFAGQAGLASHPNEAPLLSRAFPKTT